MNSKNKQRPTSTTRPPAVVSRRRKQQDISAPGKPPIGDGQVINPPTKPGQTTAPAGDDLPLITSPSRPPIGDGQVINPPPPPPKGYDLTRTVEANNAARLAKRVKGSVYVSRQEILDILNAKLRRLWKRGVQPIAYIGDEIYYCPPVDEVLRMAGEGRPHRRWTDSIFDCDDFAYSLKGYFTNKAFANGKRPFSFSVGVLWIEEPFPHALNWVVSWSDGQREQRTLYLLEPKTGQLIDLDGESGRIRVVTKKGQQPAKYGDWKPTTRVGSVYVAFI